MALAELLAAAEGKPITYEGLLVHGIVRRQIADRITVCVRRLNAVSSPVQGLRVKLDGGEMVVNTQRLKDVVLWADSAPHEVHLVCLPKGKSATLKIWNVWRDGNGVMQAWIGNAGMLVEERHAGLRLACSDGYGPVDFQNLLAEVEFLTDSNQGRP